MVNFFDKFKLVLRLIRIKQWVKNTFVLAPLVFSSQFTSLHSLTYSFLAAFFFSLASSATYIVNDLKDIEVDRLHPKKLKQRPLASGEIKPLFAISLLMVIYLCLSMGLFIFPNVIGVIAVYLVINFAYSFFLKHQPVIDIFIIALGFVLRVYAGTQALDILMSSWIFVTTLCLALYLASVKRRQELKLVGSGSRKVLKKYSVSLVERYAEISATGAIVFYSMFVMSERPSMVITIPIVLFGFFRYWYVVENDGGESPTDVLLKDRQLLIAIIVWVLTCIYLLMVG